MLKPLHTETLRGGAMTSLVLRRGLALRLTAWGEGANVSALFYNAAAPLERYNMPDTLKSQYTAYLTTGRMLHSDMGRALCSITDDTCGWHDTLCGVIDARLTAAKFGETAYQADRNEWHRNGRDNFLIELAKHGLGKRDLHANVNFFSKVVADAEGNLSFETGHAVAGHYVTLRAEMDTLVVLSNTPHPLCPAGAWSPPPVELTVSAAPAVTPQDFCLTSRPENGRAFANTASYLMMESV
jgi:urea carboxylase-associated protein 2